MEYENIGLGINSQRARSPNQMRIHMAGVRESTQRRMQDLETAGRVAVDPRRWNDPQYQVAVTGDRGDRTYRALKLPGLSRNLFSLVDQYVAVPSGVAMANQTLIVVPKRTPAGFDGTFYVLNSDQSLHDGTDTCDHLLVYS